MVVAVGGRTTTVPSPLVGDGLRALFPTVVGLRGFVRAHVRRWLFELYEEPFVECVEYVKFGRPTTYLPLKVEVVVVGRVS